MPDFNTRSYQKELLDDPDVPFRAIRRNLRELHTINRFLGGHAITLKGFKKLLGVQRRVRVCEIGCGGGDNLFVLRQWCLRHGIEADLLGIDINPHCIDFAETRYGHLGIRFMCSDYAAVSFSLQPDIVFSALFCHHFKNEALVEMLQWMGKNSSCGFFINDLQRHPLAYYSIRWLTKWCSNSYLVKNDAPLSVLRGFKSAEWRRLLVKAGLEQTRITWEWAFRYLLVYSK